jgi:hypothetical protein
MRRLNLSRQADKAAVQGEQGHLARKQRAEHDVEILCAADDAIGGEVPHQVFGRVVQMGSWFRFLPGGDSPKWQLLNQLGSEILLRFLFVMGRGAKQDLIDPIFGIHQEVLCGNCQKI